VMEMVRRCVEAGLAEQVDPERNFRPVVRLTRLGVAVMKAEVPPPETLIDLLPRGTGTTRRERGDARAALQASVELDQAAEARFQRLRVARAALARVKDVPAYVICHDSTLKHIALREPTSLAELEQVKGMGPMKVKLYGQALLSALSDE
jgi:ATP-dependent DNA helicase RecQ